MSWLGSEVYLLPTMARCCDVCGFVNVSRALEGTWGTGYASFSYLSFQQLIFLSFLSPFDFWQGHFVWFRNVMRCPRARRMVRWTTLCDYPGRQRSKALELDLLQSPPNRNHFLKFFVYFNQTMVGFFYVFRVKTTDILRMKRFPIAEMAHGWPLRNWPWTVVSRLLWDPGCPVFWFF